MPGKLDSPCSLLEQNGPIYPDNQHCLVGISCWQRTPCLGLCSLLFHIRRIIEFQVGNVQIIRMTHLFRSAGSGDSGDVPTTCAVQSNAQLNTSPRPSKLPWLASGATCEGQNVVLHVGFRKGDQKLPKGNQSCTTKTQHLRNHRWTDSLTLTGKNQHIAFSK